jgi:hypothetical protein
LAVALQHSPPPLHQAASSSLQPAVNVNLLHPKGEEFSTGSMEYSGGVDTINKINLCDPGIVCNYAERLLACSRVLPNNAGGMLPASWHNNVS